MLYSSHEDGLSHLKTRAQPWEAVIGLEIHAKLASRQKLFSSSPTLFDSPPNGNVSPFDLALPGTMPMLNQECVLLALKTALALHCDIAPRCSFDRKHYAYHDLPHGYQITQHYGKRGKRVSL